jgi:hypothetical protein
MRLRLAIGVGEGEPRGQGPGPARQPDSNPVGDLWLYAVGDTIFGVQSTSETIIEEILGLLP